MTTMDNDSFTNFDESLDEVEGLGRHLNCMVGFKCILIFKYKKIEYNVFRDV
jgi:hypothetical protein